MGLFKKIFGSYNPQNFIPDFKMSEYDNWLRFLENGGTSAEWKSLISKNHWIFKEDDTEIFMRYQKEVKPCSDKYYKLMNEIQKNWSVLYNSQNYTGSLADTLEKQCIEDIAYYDKMRKIDIKYNKDTPTNIPAFKRLAMLYEKQGKFEKAVDVCITACSYGMDERGRMIRMIKKLGELQL